MVGIRVGTIATDTPTLSQVIVKNEAAQTLFGCSPTIHHQEERRRSCGGRTPQTGSPHHLDFINEQSAGNTNSRFGEQGRVGVVRRGRLDQSGPCMLCFSE